MTLTKLDAPLGICFLAGVENVRLDGAHLVGRWKASLERIHGSENVFLIQDFLNWRNEPEDILAFTKKYGPLEDRPKAGQSFTFPLTIWISRQRALRFAWNQVRNHGRRISGWDTNDEMGSLMYESGRLTYTAQSLWSFISIDLVTYMPERLKLCMCPACPTPFFIARHLRLKFCSEKCAGWAQGISKKKWWDREGPAWRKRRAKTKARTARRGRHRAMSFKKKS
jgi:hypothetical protein